MFVEVLWRSCRHIYGMVVNALPVVDSDSLPGQYALAGDWPDHLPTINLSFSTTSSSTTFLKIHQLSHRVLVMFQRQTARSWVLLLWHKSWTTKPPQIAHPACIDSMRYYYKVKSVSEVGDSVQASFSVPYKLTSAKWLLDIMRFESGLFA